MIYLSGPMTSIPDYNFPAFNAAADKLRNQGYAVANPADNGGIDLSWEENMRNALKMLLDCDEIAMLPGWEHSRGARMEFHIAATLGMKVRYL